jgi:L-rhamnose mutarotase
MMDIYRNLFTETQWQQVLDEEKSMNINNYFGLNDKSNNILNRLLALRNTDEILEYIDEQNYVLSKSKQISRQPYIMLLIVERM